jgi:hypothetical protein
VGMKGLVHVLGLDKGFHADGDFDWRLEEIQVVGVEQPLLCGWETHGLRGGVRKSEGGVVTRGTIKLEILDISRPLNRAQSEKKRLLILLLNQAITPSLIVGFSVNNSLTIA